MAISRQFLANRGKPCKLVGSQADKNHMRNHFKLLVLPVTLIVSGLAASVANNLYAVKDDGPLGLTIASCIAIFAALTFDAARRAAKLPKSPSRTLALTIASLLALGIFGISFGHAYETAQEARYSGWEAFIMGIAPDLMVGLGIVLYASTTPTTATKPAPAKKTKTKPRKTKPKQPVKPADQTIRAVTTELTLAEHVRHLLATGDNIDYQQLSDQHKVSAGAVRTAVSRAKERAA